MSSTSDERVQVGFFDGEVYNDSMELLGRYFMQNVVDHLAMDLLPL